MGAVFSTQVEMHFVSSLVCDVFGQHNLKYNFSPRSKGGVWSTEVEVNFVNLLALEGISQHKLLPSRHGIDLVNTS
jgi:hypothetical protein